MTESSIVAQCMIYYHMISKDLQLESLLVISELLMSV